MRKYQFGLTVLLAAALLSLCMVPKAFSAEILDEIEAVVDGKPITRSEVDALARQAGNPADPIIREAAFGIVVNQLLVQMEAQKRKLLATDAEVDQSIESFRQRTGLDMLSLRSELESRGKTWRDFREEFRTQITATRLAMDIIRQEYKSEEAAQRDFFVRHYDEFGKREQVRLLHLSIPGENAPETAEKIRAAVLAGVDFTKASSSVAGLEPVDTGMLEVKDLDPGLRAAISGLKEGELSGAVALGGGTHLFLVAEKGGKKVTYEEARDEVFAKFRDKGIEEIISNWLAVRRDEAKIVRIRRGE